jgi:uncharacterized protein YuzE
MATAELTELKTIVPYFIKHKNVWANYDEEADVLYLHFKKPNHADSSELLENDVIMRYEREELVGVTILNASQQETM